MIRAKCYRCHRDRPAAAMLFTPMRGHACANGAEEECDRLRAQHEQCPLHPGDEAQCCVCLDSTGACRARIAAKTPVTGVMYDTVPDFAAVKP